MMKRKIDEPARIRLSGISGEENEKTPLFCIAPPRRDLDDSDGYLRREFDQMDVNEREKVIRELYGIAVDTNDEEDYDDNPKFLTNCLKDLDHHLCSIMPTTKNSSTASSSTITTTTATTKTTNQTAMINGFSLVKENHPEYYENDRFRLHFLRASNFDTKLASRSIVKHFNVKLELFGPEKIGKDITYDDLDENDKNVLHSGVLQPIPANDRAGRAILFTRLKNWFCIDSKNLLRAIWYTLMCLVQDNTNNISQTNKKKGTIMVCYNNGPFISDIFDRIIVKATMDMILKVIPIKIESFHFCFDDVRYRMVWGLLMVYFSKAMRVRSRMHEGSDERCRYGLMSYGMPVDKFPIISSSSFSDGSTNEDDTTYFMKWLEQMKLKEEEV